MNGYDSNFCCWEEVELCNRDTPSCPQLHRSLAASHSSHGATKLCNTPNSWSQLCDYIIGPLCITTESFMPRHVTMLSKTDLVAVAVHPIILHSSSFFQVAQHFVLWSKLMG